MEFADKHLWARTLPRTLRRWSYSMIHQILEKFPLVRAELMPILVHDDESAFSKLYDELFKEIVHLIPESADGKLFGTLGPPFRVNRRYTAIDVMLHLKLRYYPATRPDELAVLMEALRLAAHLGFIKILPTSIPAPGQPHLPLFQFVLSDGAASGSSTTTTSGSSSDDSSERRARRKRAQASPKKPPAIRDGKISHPSYWKDYLKLCKDLETIRARNRKLG